MYHRNKISANRKAELSAVLSIKKMLMPSGIQKIPKFFHDKTDDSA